MGLVVSVTQVNAVHSDATTAELMSTVWKTKLLNMRNMFGPVLQHSMCWRAHRFNVWCYIGIIVDDYSSVKHVRVREKEAVLQ